MTILYIDPGTGMIIIQLIVAAFASMLIFFQEKLNLKLNLILKKNRLEF